MNMTEFIMYAIVFSLVAIWMIRYSSTNEILCKFNRGFLYVTSVLMIVTAAICILKALQFI